MGIATVLLMMGVVYCCTDVPDYLDSRSNVCSHYENNPDNCMHDDAKTPGGDGKTPCEACCACDGHDGCKTRTCGNIDKANTSFSCPAGYELAGLDIECAAETCLSDECCVPTCDSYQCLGQGYTKKADSSIGCSEGTCNNHICCDRLTCGPASKGENPPFQCELGRAVKTNTLCLEGEGCTYSHCCAKRGQDNCGNHECSSGTAKENNTEIPCAKTFCEDTECCDVETNKALRSVSIQWAAAVAIVVAVSTGHRSTS